MMNISKYIHDYLLENNSSVIVPELGCFTIVSKPSVIRDGMAFSPFQIVEFDSEKTEDDHVFTNYIAQKANISIEKAAEEVRLFYNYFFINMLAQKKDISFDHFGTFSFNDERSIVFIPSDDFFTKNYGLGYEYISGNAARETPSDSIPDEPQPVQRTKDSQSGSGNTFLDPNDNLRYRVNTERRKTNNKKPEPTIQPKHTARTAPIYKKPERQKKSSGSNLWVLWVLFAAVLVGVAGYIFYPTLFPSFSKGTIVSPIADTDTDTDSKDEAEPEEGTVNTELAKNLDNATDKKNALNPAGSKPAVSPTPSPSPAPKPSTPTSTESKPATVTQSQGNQGSGKYILIIGSFSSNSAAEKFGRKLQAEGIAYEIIDAGNQRFRISVASFDDWNEANRQANQMKSKPYCENIWVARR